MRNNNNNNMWYIIIINNNNYDNDANAITEDMTMACGIYATTTTLIYVTII